MQAEVRNIANEIVFREFRESALARARERTEVWIYQNGRRVPMR